MLQRRNPSNLHSTAFCTFPLERTLTVPTQERGKEYFYFHFLKVSGMYESYGNKPSEGYKKRTPTRPFVTPGRESLPHSNVNHGFESFRVTHGQIGQHFSIDPNVSLFHTMNQPAVGRPILPSRRVDPGYPQTPQIAFAGPSIAVGIPQALHHRLIRSFKETMTGTIHALGHLDDFFMSTAGYNSTFYSTHNSLSCEPLGADASYLKGNKHPLCAPNSHN
jgi:hypothetical protein